MVKFKASSSSTIFSKRSQRSESKAWSASLMIWDTVLPTSLRLFQLLQFNGVIGKVCQIGRTTVYAGFVVLQLAYDLIYRAFCDGKAHP